MIRKISALILCFYSTICIADSFKELTGALQYEHAQRLEALKHSLQKDMREGNYENKKTSNVLVFVSFSMPQKSIEAYLHDAKMLHANVVIRGLINNSFQATFKKMAELIKNSDGTGVELSPIWFDKFAISRVPAIVVLPKNASCLEKEKCNPIEDYDVIYGDMSLFEALRQIRDKGNVAQETASLILGVS